MKPLIAALLLALAASPALAGDVVDTTFAKAQGPHSAGTVRRSSVRPRPAASC